MSLNVRCDLLANNGETPVEIDLVQTLTEESKAIIESESPGEAYLEWVKSRNDDGCFDEHIAEIARLMKLSGDKLRWYIA